MVEYQTKALFYFTHIVLKTSYDNIVDNCDDRKAGKYAATNESEDGTQRNRRVEIILQYEAPDNE